MANGKEVLRVEAGEGFVATGFTEGITRRAMAYLEAGYPVHLSGAAGTGKTTLAMHLAALRGRPVVLVYGDEEFGSSDLTGRDKGFVSRRVVDNFVRSVLKTEESVSSQWVDHRLTTACKSGATLVYDEFSRSRAEANNALLSILEEGILALPGGRNGGYVPVHPEFRAVFTSNPDEYAGVYTPQSALLDRMITIQLDGCDTETEVRITSSRSGLALEDARKVVALVAAARQAMNGAACPSLRASIMIARIASTRGVQVARHDPVFREICADVLGPALGGETRLAEFIKETLTPLKEVQDACANQA